MLRSNVTLLLKQQQQLCSRTALASQPGDMVKENETIAQVETDKVTIDIKSPSDGRLLGILVQADDTVVPGQLVATVDNSSPAVAPQPAGPAAPHPAKQPEPSASAAAPAGAPAAGGPLSTSKRVPGILFPPRIAPDGRRISALPASEAHALLTQLQAGAGAVPQPQAAAPAAAPAPSLTSALPEAPRRATVSWLADTPGKRQLTDSEIDMIMLGGAS